MKEGLLGSNELDLPFKGRNDAGEHFIQDFRWEGVHFPGCASARRAGSL
jgi:hypothetical protein